MAKTNKKTSKKKTTKAAKSSRKKTTKRSTKKKSTKKTTKTSKKTTAGSAKSKSTSKKTSKKTSKTTSNRSTKPTKRPTKASREVEKAKPLPKTKLKKRELDHYLQLLLMKRAELIGDMDSMTAEALNVDSANLSHYADHMADVGSDNYEQELTLGLMESERQLLQEIDEAIGRIADRTYGVCVATGKPIGKPRLEVKPWAKYCIEAAREMERNGTNSGT